MLLPLENESVSSLGPCFTSPSATHARDRILTAAATGSNADSVRLLGHAAEDPVLAPSLDHPRGAVCARRRRVGRVTTLVHDDDGVMAYFVRFRHRGRRS